MKDDVPVSLIIEEEQSDEFGIDELCRHSKRVLWLSVRDGRKVVYKGLTEELRHHPEEIAALRKEYSIGLRVDCEGVVRFYSFEMHPRLGPIIVMEYVDGPTLHEYMRESKPTLEERLKISRDIAESLAVMHAAGILHRDLKPDNILIRKRDQRTKIIDFGHADAEDFMIYKNAVGTPQYGSPEQQVLSEGSTAGDIYSFGKILEELLPERRYKAIKDACVSADESKRPDIRWVIDHLSNSGHGGSRWKWIMGVVLLLLLATSFLFYLSNGMRNAGTDVATDVEEVDSIINVQPIESEPVEEVTDEVTTKQESPSATKVREAAVQSPSENDEIAATITNKNIPENITALVDKYAREADIINNRYGKLSYIENIEENTNLRLKRGKEHSALSDSMMNELTVLGVDETTRTDAYWHLWKYIVLETNRIDGVDEVRENFLQNY